MHFDGNFMNKDLKNKMRGQAKHTVPVNFINGPSGGQVVPSSMLAPEKWFASNNHTFVYVRESELDYVFSPARSITETGKMKR